MVPVELQLTASAVILVLTGVGSIGTEDIVEPAICNSKNSSLLQH
jgi:hypothetical protein